MVFQYCSYKGLPPNDITQPDEAPSSACADGSGRWRNLNARIEVDANGDAFIEFWTRPSSQHHRLPLLHIQPRECDGEKAVTDPENWVRS